MPKVSLSRMNVEALMDLRKRVDAALLEHRAEIQNQLERMGSVIPLVAQALLAAGDGEAH